ncbi:MAG: relaxase/mobilization nuclease domain-containing protein [Cytophagales bacterium]|nr:relaxase/mobilization nuclease domain-containing protein [Cytophagales bacterium]
MVAKVISGKDIQGALNYNEHKVKEGVAECLLAHRFHGGIHEMNFHDKLNLLKYFTDKNKRVKTNTLHISLNFDVGENLDKGMLCQIASLYMDKIGFGNQPYLVYEHKDAAHPHVHIVTTNIQDNGKRIDIHNIGRNQSEKARKEIEKEFGLVKAKSKKKDQKEFINAIDVQKAIYGKSETKRSIFNVVGLVTRTYKYTSLPELNAVLKAFNVIADRGNEGSRMHERKGLIYSLIDEKGNKVGVPIKASSIYGKPTLAFLEKQFQLNQALRKPYKNSLKQAIDQAVQTGPKDKAALLKTLDKKGVQIIFRENTDGRIYGVTFVDHRTKCVFNGSNLGKNYSAKGILERLTTKDQFLKQFRPGYTEVKNQKDNGPKNNANLPKIDLGTDKILSDLIKTESLDYLSPDATMKLKKRRKKRKGRTI